MMRHVRGAIRGNHLAPFNEQFGDWFVLHQVYKNVTYPNFVKLISEMADVDEQDAAALIKEAEPNIDFEAASVTPSRPGGSVFGSRKPSAVW